MLWMATGTRQSNAKEPPAAVAIAESPWTENAAAAIQALESDADRGLISSIASERLREFGPNLLREGKSRSRLVAFLMQFANWMIGLLAAAAATSVAIGEWQDALLIAAIVMANAVLGYVQEQAPKKPSPRSRSFRSRRRKSGATDNWSNYPSSRSCRGTLLSCEAATWRRPTAG